MKFKINYLINLLNRNHFAKVFFILLAFVALPSCSTFGKRGICNVGIYGFSNYSCLKIADKTTAYKKYKLNYNIDFARILSVAPSTNDLWQPVTRYDFPIQKPKEWSVYTESLNAYNFASNTAVMLGTFHQARGKDLKPILFEMADELDKIALETSILTPKGGMQIYNKFSYSQKAGANYTEVIIPYGFGSGFSNALISIGYMNLYKLTLKEAYKVKARSYLIGIIDDKANQKLFQIDGEGYLWFEMIASDSVKMHPYNGQIAIVASLLFYQKMTNSHEFDKYILAGITTLSKYLRYQIRPNGYFGYMIENPDSPDYGQERAVNYARFLCDLTEDKDLCEISKEFNAKWEIWNNIKK